MPIFKPETAVMLVSALFGKMELVAIPRSYRKICRAHVVHRMKPITSRCSMLPNWLCPDDER